MGKNSAYYKAKDKKCSDEVSVLCSQLPSFVTAYIKSLLDCVNSTKVAYAREILNFFLYLKANNKAFDDIANISSDDFGKLTHFDFENYRNSLAAGLGGLTQISNSAIARKFAALRGLCKYCYDNDIISHNPTDKVKIPKKKRKDKDIVYMRKNEVKKFNDTVLDCGTGRASPRQIKFNEKTQERDYAIITLLLNSGIRVSELVGMDVIDVDFDNLLISVVRKGSGHDIVAINRETSEAIRDYITGERVLSAQNCSDDKALFLSLKHNRISVDAVESVVKKYAELSGQAKHITAHKLRSTFGTNLYQATHDIELTRAALGHARIETTSAYYVAETDEDRDRIRNTDLYD